MRMRLARRVMAAVATTFIAATGLVAVYAAPAQADTTYTANFWTSAPGYNTYRTTASQTGTLYGPGNSYVYCKVQGDAVSDAYGNTNYWWLLTDLDTGWPWRYQFVPAYYLGGSLNTNNKAYDVNGNVIPNCPSHWTTDPTLWSYSYSNQYVPDPNKWWRCGPAALKIALSAANITYYSMDTLSSGSPYLNTDALQQTPSITNIISVYNNLAGGPYYSNATNPSASTLKSHVETTVLKRARVFIANVRGSATDTDGRTHTFNDGHYLTVVGTGNSGAWAQIADPDYGIHSWSYNPSGYYYMTWAQLAQWILTTSGYAYIP